LPASVTAKSTCPFAHHAPCCSSLSHVFNSASTSGEGNGAGSRRPNLRQRGGESLHRCRSETLCFTLRATISSISIHYSSENERHCAQPGTGPGQNLSCSNTLRPCFRRNYVTCSE